MSGTPSFAFILPACLGFAGEVSEAVMKTGKPKWIGFYVGLVLLGSVMQAVAEAGPDRVVLTTGGEQNLVTAEQTFLIAPFSEPRLLFTFGFATDEAAEPGEFSDSFTFTLEGGSSGSTLLFLTADTTGVVWVPSTPGTVPLEPGAVTGTATEYPDGIEPALAHRYAYRVEASLPEEFAGGPAIFRADLFDNLNGTESVGWFADVSVVPEPRALVLAVLAGSIFFLRRSKR